MSSQIEILSDKFNNLLNQYKKTYQEFLNTINYGDDNLTSIPNSAFIGQSNINTIDDSNVKNCKSECNLNQNCSGATFDKNNKTCTLNSGLGNIVNSKNQTAIVRKALYYTNQLQEINNKLMETNSSMMNLANSNIDNYSQTERKINEKVEILNHNYKTLEKERLEIYEMTKQFKTLNSQLENGNMNILSNYYKYIIYLLIAIFLIFILFKINFTNEQIGGGNGKKPTFIIIFLLAVIVLNAYLKN